MGCSLLPAVCDAAEAFRAGWGTIALWFWIVVAVLGLLVALAVLDRVNRVFGRPGVYAVLGSLALGAAYVLGRRSVGRVEATPGPRALERDEIMALQRALVPHGYVGAIDGVFGARSEAALIAYQRGRGDPPTGRPTPAQLKALGVWR